VAVVVAAAAAVEAWVLVAFVWETSAFAYAVAELVATASAVFVAALVSSVG